MTNPSVLFVSPANQQRPYADRLRRRSRYFFHLVVRAFFVLMQDTQINVGVAVLGSTVIRAENHNPSFARNCSFFGRCNSNTSTVKSNRFLAKAMIAFGAGELKRPMAPGLPISISFFTGQPSSTASRHLKMSRSNSEFGLCSPNANSTATASSGKKKSNLKPAEVQAGFSL